MTKDELLALGPNPASIRETINHVRNKCAGIEFEIDFNEYHVIKDEAVHERRRACCHGGVFTLALCEQENTWYPDADGRLSLSTGDDFYVSQPLTYAEGADEFARRVYSHLDAEIPNRITLSTFMHEHPQIWGNKHGAKMFEPKGFLAFNRNWDDITIEDIFGWWRGVAARKEEWDAGRGVEYWATA